ncbi:ribonuclease H [Senna tora]|uniref:Ribonuclease H n=1 Tax=Senna tora TaxID=362788 RepID=A0A834TYK3_9FABA|nr:ribonuclease H [Senna tora]
MIAAGLYKSIGNGRSTSIWRDSWIPGVQSLHLQPASRLALSFDKNEPNRRMGMEDRGKWEIFVKSCYKLAMKEIWDQISFFPDLFCDVPVGFWRNMWKLPLLSRFKAFMWRACHNIIPTIEVLERRGVQIDENCVFCNSESESVYHVLFDCDGVQRVWDEASFNFSSRRFHTTLLEWMAVEWSSWSQEQRCFLIMAIYFIWEARNKKKFANETPNLDRIWAKVERSWNEQRIASSGAYRDFIIPCNLRWEKPKAPFVKMNVDAAFKSNGEAAIGGLMRDHNGWVLAAFSGTLPALDDVTMAEALAVKRGVEMAMEVGVKDLQVECDSKLVVEMLNSGCEHMSFLSSLCSSILALCGGFNNVEFIWIPRCCNQSADCLSRFAKVSSCNKVWLNSVPMFLAEYCTADLS